MKIKDEIALKITLPISRLAKFPISLGIRNNGMTSLFVMILVALLYLPLRGWIIQTMPFLAVLFAFNIYILPGMALATLLAKQETWIERLPLGMVLSQVLLSFPGVLVMNLQSNMKTYFGIFAGITVFVMALTLLLLKRREQESIKETGDALPLSLLTIMIVGVGALFYISKYMPLIGDDWVAMPWFWQFQTSDHIMSTYPYHGIDLPTNVRQEFGVLALNVAMVNYISGLEPIKFYLIFRPFVVITGSIAFFFFAKNIFKKRLAAGFVTSFWMLFMLTSLGKGGGGYNLVVRILQDKFFLLFIVLPLGLGLLLRYFHSYEKRDLLMFGLICWAAGTTHPIGPVLIGLPAAVFGLIHLIIEHNWKSFLRLLLVGALIAIGMTLPLVQYIGAQETSLAFSIESGFIDPNYVNRVRLVTRAYRLWFLDGGRYILHPAIILKREMLVSILAFPFLLWGMRKNTSARLIFAAFFLVTPLLYFPPTAMLIGKMVTPWLLWRVAWVPELASWTILSGGVWIIVERISKLLSTRLTNATQWLSPLVIPLLALMFYPSLNSSVRFANDLHKNPDLSGCLAPSPLIKRLGKTLHEDTVILSNRTVNFCIPAYSPWAKVVEYRGVSTLSRFPEERRDEAWQRLTDVAYYSAAKYFSEDLVDIIRRYTVQYVLIEQNRLLDLQLNHLKGWFTLIDSVDGYNLYKVNNLSPSSSIIKGNTALLNGEWNKALEQYNTALERSDQDERLLAHIGLAQVYMNLGQIQESIKHLEQVVSLEPSEGIAHLLLADMYMAVNHVDDAIAEYEKSASLIPRSPTILARLGDAYRIHGDDQRARELYEKATSLQADIRTGPYFMILGQYFSNSKWYEDAFDAYQQARRLSPASVEPLVSVGNNYLAQGELNKAEEAFYEVRKLDHWNSLSSIGLGQVYSKTGDSDKAIQQFQEGIQLDPSNSIINALLANEVKNSKGLEQAIQTISHALSYELNLPSAIQVLADLYVESNRIEEALQLYNTAISGDPLSLGTYLVSIAKAYNRANDYQSAIDFYLQAEMLGAPPFGVYLGLAPIYQNQGWSDLALGMYFAAVRESPFTAASHAALGNSFRSMAKWDQAIDEFLTAISREPTSPIGYISLANAYRILGNYSQAIELYNQANAIQPDQIDGYLGLGQVYLDMGYIQSALEQFQKAIELEPTDIDAYNAISKVYLSLGNMDNALKILIQAQENIPTDLSIYDSIAEIEIMRGREDEALKWLEKGIEINPDIGLGYKNLADEYLRIGDIERALELYQKAIEITPQLETAYAQLASIYKRNKQYDAAYQVYMIWKEKLPHSILPYLGLGDLYKEQGKLNEAEVVYRQATKFPFTTANVYLSLSNLKKIQHDWEGAIRILEEATIALPYSTDAHKNLADLYLQRGEVEKAQSNYKKAIELNPSLISAYLSLSQIAMNSGNLEEAQQILENALQINPTSTDALAGLASFLESQGNISKAESLLQKARQLSPNNLINYLNLGSFYQRQKRYDESISTLSQALSIPPISSGIYIALANAYTASGQHEKALQWINQGIALNPNNPSPYLTLSTLLQSRYQWEDAIKTLKTASEIQPGNPAIYLALGNIYKNLGNKEESEKAYQLACALDPILVECHTALGNLYAANGQWDKAIGEFQKAIQIAPTDITSYARISQIYQIIGSTSKAKLTINLGVIRSLDKQSAYAARASFYKMNGDWKRAEADFRKAWQINPQNQNVGQQLSQFYLQRGDWQSALGVLETLANQLSANAQSFIDLGNLYTLRADWNAAIGAFSRAIELDKTAFSAYTGLAKVYQLRGEVEKSLQLLEHAIEIMPSNPQAYINLGDAYQSRMDFQRAQSAYQKALQIDSRNITALTRLDSLNLKAGGQGIDLTPLKAQAEITPSASLYIALATQYQTRGDLQTALYYLEKATKLEHYNYLVWLTLGNYYRTLQEWDYALDYLNKALEYSPNSTTILSSIGAVQNAQGDTDLAMKTYTQAIDIDHSQISNYISLANLQASLGMTNEAKKTIYDGLAIVPLGGLDITSQALLDGYSNLALIYANEGDREKAIEIINAGLAIAPGASPLYLSLGGVYGGLVLDSKAELDVAEANYQWAASQYFSASTVEQRTAASFALDQTEIIYSQAKENLEELQSNLQVNISQASNAYQQALKYQPDSVIALIGLGRLSNAAGDTQKAIEYYQLAIDLNPTSTLALNNLANYLLDLERPYDALPLFHKSLSYSPSNLATLYGLFRAYKSINDFNASDAVAPINYGHYWLLNYINLFRTFEKNNPLK